MFEKGQWQLTQPMMKVEVTGPLEFQDFLCKSINQRNGIIAATDMRDDYFILEAEVPLPLLSPSLHHRPLSLEAPLSDMFGYASELRSGTQGKGEFSMEYARSAIPSNTPVEHKDRSPPVLDTAPS